MYARRAVAFIEENRDRPFFVYLAHTMPHVPIFASERFAAVAPGALRRRDRGGRRLGGQVLAALGRSTSSGHARRLRLGQRPVALVRRPRGVGGTATRGKGTAFEGGVRVPLVARWPGRIPARTVVSEPAMTIDVLPTIARIVGRRSRSGPSTASTSRPFSSARRARARRTRRSSSTTAPSCARARGRYKLVLPHRSQTLDGPAGSGGVPGKYKEVDVPLASTTSWPTSARRRTWPRPPDVVQRLLDAAERAREDLGDSLTKRVGRGLREPGRAAQP